MMQVRSFTSLTEQSRVQKTAGALQLGRERACCEGVHVWLLRACILDFARKDGSSSAALQQQFSSSAAEPSFMYQPALEHIQCRPAYCCPCLLPVSAQADALPPSSVGGRSRAAAKQQLQALISSWAGHVISAHIVSPYEHMVSCLQDTRVCKDSLQWLAAVHRQLNEATQQCIGFCGRVAACVVLMALQQTHSSNTSYVQRSCFQFRHINHQQTCIACCYPMYQLPAGTCTISLLSCHVSTPQHGCSFQTPAVELECDKP